MDTKTKTFVEKAKVKHGACLYSYDKVIYLNNYTKVTITCKLHQDFEQTPHNHLKGSGCPKCGTSSETSKNKRAINFIKKANIIHGNIYNYEKVDYTNSFTEVTIGCSVHGDFKQVPSNHTSGSGCHTCARLLMSKKQRHSTEDFVNKARLIHKELYEYSQVNYEGTHTKIKINCKFHGIFYQTPSLHLRGGGCPMCGNLKQGWTKTTFKENCKRNNKGLGILYVLRCFNSSESFYKIGITSRSVKLRYSSKNALPYDYEILQEIIKDSEIIYDLEHDILRDLYDFKYKPSISFGGDTECFSDITLIDKALN